MSISILTPTRVCWMWTLSRRGAPGCMGCTSKTIRLLRLSVSRPCLLKHQDHSDSERDSRLLCNKWSRRLRLRILLNLIQVWNRLTQVRWVRSPVTSKVTGLNTAMSSSKYPFLLKKSTMKMIMRLKSMRSLFKRSKRYWLSWTIKPFKGTAKATETCLLPSILKQTFSKIC